MAKTTFKLDMKEIKLQIFKERKSPLPISFSDR